MNYIVGIDEAGRGPLAGPVAVGVVKLPENRREEIFEKMKTLKKEGNLDFAVALVSNNTIDKSGIVFAIKDGIEGSIKKLDIELNAKFLLDGGLSVPKEFKNQKTIIKGDELEPSISLASIMAKVTRDRYMVQKSKEFPEYGFEIHKGYGTLKHREAIKKNGLSNFHRKTFCRAFV